MRLPAVPGDERVEHRYLLCLSCGAVWTVPPDQIKWRCNLCGKEFYFARCMKCDKAQIVMGFPAGLSFECDACHEQNTCGIFKHPKSATAADVLPDVIAGMLADGWPIHDPEFVVLIGWTIVGGYNLPWAAGSRCDVVGTTSGMRVRNLEGNQWLDLPLADLVRLDVGGPGEQVHGGGFIGGGFGLKGAVEGMLVASVLNAVTTRTTINTFVHVATNASEIVLHSGTQPPQVVELQLAALRGRITARLRNEHIGKLSGATLVDDLAHLAALRSSGALTEAEFEAAKKKLLGL